MDLVTKIIKIGQEALENKVFPGCVIGVVTKDNIRSVIPIGRTAYSKDAPLVTENTMYDVASITKSIPTSSLALLLIDQNKLHVNDKLTDYVPEFSNSDRDTVRIKHLLTYTLDGYSFVTTALKGTGKSISELTASDLDSTLMNHNFEKRPGEVCKYTSIPSALLGIVIERIMNDRLDNLAQKYFFDPMSMNRTTFYPELFSRADIAPTEEDNWRGLVHGVVHDESAYIYKKAGRIMGHAGLFSTAPDILRFLYMLLNRGTVNGKRYFSEQIIAQMSTNQVVDLGDYTGLGWELYQPRYMSEYCSERTFGKTGFTGTVCVCDVKKGVAYVILSNRIHPTRPVDAKVINEFRKKVSAIVFQSINR